MRAQRQGPTRILKPLRRIPVKIVRHREEKKPGEVLRLEGREPEPALQRLNGFLRAARVDVGPPRIRWPNAKLGLKASARRAALIAGSSMPAVPCVTATA